VVAQLVPQVPVVDRQPGNVGALQAPNTPTIVASNPVVVAVPSLPTVITPPPTQATPGIPPQVGPGATQVPPGSVVTTLPSDPGQGPRPPRPPSGSVVPPVVAGEKPVVAVTPGTGGQVAGLPDERPTGQRIPVADTASGSLLAASRQQSEGREPELVGLHYSVIYRNYEAQSLVDDIGRPLYALASGYEHFLYLEGRRPVGQQPPAAAPAREMQRR
jgi:hypothetical protein